MLESWSMKKILAIVVLGLLWSNSGYSYVMQDLIETLEETKKPKSIEVAETLKSINAKEKSYDLIIRKANLNLEDAKNIATAIKKIDQNKGPQLGTISMSFNEDLKDEGVITILNHIPLTTSVNALKSSILPFVQLPRKTKSIFFPNTFSPSE